MGTGLRFLGVNFPGCTALKREEGRFGLENESNSGDNREPHWYHPKRPVKKATEDYITGRFG